MKADKDAVEKIAKCLDMMSSDHDGEVLAAARMATKLLKKAGVEWRQILGYATPAPPQPTPHQASGFQPGFGASPFQQYQHPYQDQHWQRAYQEMQAQQQAAHAAMQANAYNFRMEPEVKVEEREDKKRSWFGKKA